MSGTGSNGSNPERGGRTRVLVLFGGQSGEHDVSLRSAQTVIRALDPAKYDVQRVGITREGRWLISGDPMAALTAQSPLFDALPETVASPDDISAEEVDPTQALSGLSQEPVDVVFPVLHGPMGEDGTIQGLLELAGIPYVGSGVLGSAVAMDKAMAKLVLAQAGVPQARWLLVHRSEWRRDQQVVVDRVGHELGYPCFVKPANMGSSVGVTKAHEAQELVSGIDEAAHYDRRVVIEAGIDGRELEISVLGNEDPIASVAGEIVPSNEFYDYDAKYIDDRSELIIPAQLPDGVLEMMQRIAIDAFKALDLAGLARVDFFLERDTNQLLLNEANTIPGFTSISMYPMLWKASGIPLEELVERLIELALERHGEG